MDRITTNKRTPKNKYNVINQVKGKTTNYTVLKDKNV